MRIGGEQCGSRREHNCHGCAVSKRHVPVRTTTRVHLSLQADLSVLASIDAIGQLIILYLVVIRKSIVYFLLTEPTAPLIVARIVRERPLATMPASCKIDNLLFVVAIPRPAMPVCASWL